MFLNIEGPRNILFKGQTSYIKIDIDKIWQDPRGAILWVEDTEGTMYNWDNILVIRKIRGEK